MLRRWFYQRPPCVGLLMVGIGVGVLGAWGAEVVAAPQEEGVARPVIGDLRSAARPVHETPWSPNPVAYPGELDSPPVLSARTSFQHLRIISGGTATFHTPPLDDFAGMSDTGVIPPDTMGAVGPTHLMSVLNGGVAMYNRDGTPATTQQTLQQFWGSLGTTPGMPASDVFDPKVLYDQYSERWVTTCDANGNFRDGTSNAWVLIGISDSSDPTLGWNLYAVRGNISPIHTNHWPDYPGFGVDPNNVIVTNNMFTVAAEPDYVHADIWVFDKASLINGGAGTFGALVEATDYALIHDPCGNGNITYQPCHTFGQTTATAENYILDQGWAEQGPGVRRFFGVKRITGIGAAATIGPCAPSGGFGNFIEVAGYGFGTAGASQKNCSQTIRTNGARLLDAVWRNSRIWVTHAVGTGVGLDPDAPASRAEAAWYEIDPATAAGFPGGTPVQQGRIADPSRAYYFPSIAVNADNCAAIGFSGSDTSIFVSAFYTVREPADPLGTMQSISLLKAGEGHYWKTFGFGSNRWGDYSATEIDPLDDKTFWTIQEYAKVPNGSVTSCSSAGDGSGVWGTWWGKFQCESSVCPCDPDVSGDQTLDDIDLQIVIDCVVDGTCGGCTNSCDVNCDGTIDFIDAGVVHCPLFGNDSCCDQPVGGCAGGPVGDGQCAVTLEAFCLDKGGEYLGDGSNCKDYCPCDGDVNGSGGNPNITDVIIVKECVELGLCDNCTAGCDVNCDNAIDFIDVGVADCTFQNFSDCCDRPVGACIGGPIGDGQCAITLEAFCLAGFAGSGPGEYLGDGSACSAPEPPIAGVNSYGRALEMAFPSASGGNASSVAALTALRITLVSLYHPGDPQPVDQPDFSPHEGDVRYLNLLRDGDGNVVTECVSSSAFNTTYQCATVGCTPEFEDWVLRFGSAPVYVSGNAIIPNSTYTMAQLAVGCVGNEATCTDASEEVAFATTRFGDSEPNGAVNVTDIVNTVDVVKQLPTALWEYQVYVRKPYPAPHNDATNVTDIVVHVDALKLVSYLLPICCPCDPGDVCTFDQGCITP